MPDSDLLEVAARAIWELGHARETWTQDARDKGWHELPEKDWKEWDDEMSIITGCVGKEYYRAAAVNVIAALEAGIRLVRREATEEMVKAGFQPAGLHPSEINAAIVELIWDRFWTAAPTFGTPEERG